MSRTAGTRRRGAPAVALVGAVAVGLSACSTGSGAVADYPAWGSAAELGAAADTIIVGTVLDQRAEDIDIVIHSDSDDPELNPSAGLPDDGDQAPSDVVPFIVYRIEVTEGFAGAVAGDVVEVMVRDQATSEPEPRLEVGGHYLLFLSEAYLDLPRNMLNPDQAAYRAEPDGTYRSLTPESTIALEVTRADLELLRTAG